MRLFIGIELDPVVRAAAADVIVRLRQTLQRQAGHVEARWIAPANLHITLWFIGEVPDAGTDALIEALKIPAWSLPPFDLSLAGCGAFPPSGQPRVFWIGVRDGVEQMKQLYAAVGARLLPLGYEGERREYTPHLTVARVKDAGRGAGPLIRGILRNLPADCGAFRVAEFTLFRSRLSPAGSAYEPLLRVPLS